jgi:hypothetical protein
MVVLLTAAILGSSGVIAGHGPGPAAALSSVVDLLNGSFTLTTSNGDISGVYTGSSSVSPSGRTEASLDLQVTSGTNSFEGATGRLTGDGAGAFTGEGNFSLTLRGSISTVADPAGFRVRGKVSGTSSVSCVSQTTAVTLDGEGALGKLGDVHAALTHLVGGSGCSP